MIGGEVLGFVLAIKQVSRVSVVACKEAGNRRAFGRKHCVFPEEPHEH